MFKSLLLSALIVTATQALADPKADRDLSILPADVAARVVLMQGYGSRYDATIEAILAEWSKPAASATPHELDLSLLPEDVAARVVEMQAYGDRFDSTIRAIFIEAMTPHWGADCPPEAGDIPAS